MRAVFLEVQFLIHEPTSNDCHRATHLAGAEGIWRRRAFAYASDPAVTKYLSWRPTTDPADSAAFLERCSRVWESGEACVWAITETGDDGLVRMIEARPTGHGVEIGYGLNRSAWGNGIMTEAVRAVISWALAERDVYRVWAYVNVENTASQRVLENAGMTREDTLHRWASHPNAAPKPPDAYMYAVWQ